MDFKILPLNSFFKIIKPEMSLFETDIKLFDSAWLSMQDND